LICSGDVRQIPPVVRHGDRHDIVRSSMTSSYLWDKFQTYRLTVNLRLIDNEDVTQRQYTDFLLHIGEGCTDSQYYTTLATNNITGTTVCITNKIKSFNNDKEAEVSNALHFIYPTHISIEEISKRAILCATNEQVDEWNSTVQIRLHKVTSINPIHTLKSKDTLCEVDDPKGTLQAMLDDTVLNNFNTNGVPTHLLKLRIGDICILLYTLARRHRLANNSRVKILHITSYSVRVQSLHAVNSTAFVIPRIRFKFRLPFGQSFMVQRTQFPLRLAYALTFNKAQGQSLNTSIIDIRVPPFTHGHLYVALSRATDAHKVAIVGNDATI